MSLTRVDTDILAFAPTISSSSSSSKELQLAYNNNSSSNNDATNDFELTFLDEFLLHEHELVPDPHSPAPSDDAGDDDDDALAIDPEVAIALSSNSSSDVAVVPSSAATDLPFAGKVDAIAFEPFGAMPAFDTTPLTSTAAVSTPTSSSSSSYIRSDSPMASSSSGDEEDSERATGSAEPLDRKARRRAQVAISARRHRCRKKNELMDLRKEATYLDAQLDFLRSKHKMLRPHGAVAEWEERAMAQRHKRKQSEEQNEELRRALFLQGAFITNFKSLFASSLFASAELNMRQLLHTYTRLGTNAHSRRRDYDAICSDAKLDLAIDVIVRETAALDVHTPSITMRHVEPAPQQFGATTVTAYAFDTLDMRRIFVAACGAIRDSGREWPQYSPVDAHVQVVDAPRDNVRYGVSSIRYRSDVAHAEEVVVESRAISYYRVTEAYGVLLWDFVDVDDLYPLDAATTLKRDVIGAVLVRREVCPDGVERVVCRSICTKLHLFNVSMPSHDIKRFSQSTEMGSEVCGSVVYNSIRNDFTKSLVAM